MLGHLARRGLSHPNAAAFVKRTVGMRTQGQERIDMEFPVWGAVLVYVTVLAAAIGISLLSYMLNEVITTLCMVETPVAAITVSPSQHEVGDKAEKDRLLETGPTITLINQKPITSSIRGTIKHLVAHAGRAARFRGYRLYILYSILFSFVSAFFASLVPRIPGQPIVVAALTGATLANVHATWTHKIVSMPTDKSFCARLVSRKQWKTLALPAAIEAAIPYVAIYLVCGIGMLLNLHRLNEHDIARYNCAQITGLVVRVIAMIIAVFASSLFLCMPAMVTLIRIEASVLPEDQDTIVPFDRTFGGKLVSQLMGGSGKIAFLDAWRSFNWEARRRLIKLFIKSFLIVAGAVFVVAHVVIAEMFVIMGSAMGKYLAQARQQGFAQ